MPGCLRHDSDNDAQDDGDRGADSYDSSFTGTTFVDLGDFVTSDADIARWSEIRRGLEARFDEVCGDTFCEGDYSNIESLGFTCSVTSKQGRIRDVCGRSRPAPSPSTARPEASLPACLLRVPRPADRAGARALEGVRRRSLSSRLPGLSGSLYDALGDCFDHPLSEVALPSPSEGPYTDVADGLQDEEIDAWYAMTSALRAGFDDVCGDSFCEGEYTNLRSLRFRCSENTGTGKLGTCAWIFAGSDTSRDRRGSSRCANSPSFAASPWTRRPESSRLPSRPARARRA